MKLRYLFALSIFATVFTGCDEIEYSDAKPVENPQLPSITQNDFSVTPSTALETGINLDDLAAQTDDPSTYMVTLYKINVGTSDLPEDAVVTGNIQLALTPDFENPFDLSDVTTNNGTVSVPLSSLIYTRGTMISTKDPREYTIYYRVPVYVTVNGGQYKLGDRDFYYCDGNSFQEEGIYPGYTVEAAYYLVGPNGTDLESAVKFEHSGYNIYDDTVFTISVKFSEGNSSWIIVPESVYESGTIDKSKCYGPTIATALDGSLDLGKTGTIEDNSRYEFSVNISTLTYTIKSVADFDYLYTPGNSNGWDQLSSQMLSTNDYTSYSGYAYFDGGFKFTSAPNWDGINYGAGAEEGTISTTGGDLSAEAGLYWCNVNINTLTYSSTLIETIGLIGDATEGGWDASTPMTPSEDFLTWTGEFKLGAGSFKFRANNGWDINLGGNSSNDSYDDLVQNGQDLASPGAGTYTITLDLSKLPYSCKLVAK